MAADVMSYSMFIAIATLFAAPFLFALSGQLLTILKGVMTQVSQSGGGGGGGGMSFGEITLTAEDFNKFAYMALTVTSVMSAVIVATIRKGDVKSGLSTIPTFIIVTLILYTIAAKGFGLMLGGLIG